MELNLFERIRRTRKEKLEARERKSEIKRVLDNVVKTNPEVKRVYDKLLEEGNVENGWMKYINNNVEDEVERLNLMDHPSSTDIIKALYIQDKHHHWTSILCNEDIIHHKYSSELGKQKCVFCAWDKINYSLYTPPWQK